MDDRSQAPLLQMLFESALQDYERQTGTVLAKHPLAEQLEDCHTVESVAAVLREQAQSSSELQEGDGRLMRSLNRIVSVLHSLSTSNVLYMVAGLVFPPSKAIMSGVAILLSAVRDVGATSNYDALVELLETIERFLNRLDIYTAIRPTVTMTEFIIKVMVELLSTLAVVTKQIKREQPMKSIKKLLEENGIETVLQRLDRLTQDEARTTAAQTLEVVYGLAHDIRVVIDDGKASIDTVRNALELLQRIASDISSAKRDKLLKDVQSWLSPPDPWKNHNIACALCHTGTGMWFIRGNTFYEWKSSSPSPLLWIYGKPGAGKSILSSTIIQEIDTIRKSGLAFLAFFYCDFSDDQKRDRRGLVSSVLIQLCRQSHIYCDILSKLYSEHSKGSQHPSDGALVRCLMDILKLPGQPPVYLIVDALDECSNTSALPSPRENILKLVAELINSRLSNLRICVTSRPEADIRTILNALTFRSICLHDESGQIEDIDNYIKSVVTTGSGMRRWRAEDKQLVIDFLTKKADGMFRWVYCQLVHLRNCLPGRIRHALAALPETLDKTYERMLREIDETNWPFAHRLFQCLAVASRPLRVEELAEFLTFDFEAGPIPEFCENWREEDPVDAVISTCSTLLSVIVVDNSQVIQFSHSSVREFLASSRLAESSAIVFRRYHISIPHAHTVAAQACLGLLLHLPENITGDDLQNLPLAEYAASHWFDHARSNDESQNVEEAAQYLFDPRKLHFSVWVWIYQPLCQSLPLMRGERPSSPIGTPLHYVALCGLHTIVKFLVIERSQDVNALGLEDDTTPLHLASFEGYPEVARALLEHGADVAAQCESGSTPLHEASIRGHTKVSRVLLEYGADVAAQSEREWTPLHMASFWGHAGISRVLLEHGANVKALDERKSTPLHLASYGGHAEVARILLEHGADATAQNEFGWAPLHRASSGGYAKVTCILLEHGADTTAQDRHGRTPLHEASSNGYVQISSILLEHGADPKARDNMGWTPLHGASSGVGPASTFFRPSADATAQDEDPPPPWEGAIPERRTEIVRLLLGHGADATAQTEDGSTPLHEASSKGRVEIVRDLLEHGADITALAKHGRTPLHWASSGGHMEVMRILLGCGADSEAQDEGGLIPLHFACSRGHVEVARLLLEHGTNVSAQDEGGSIPLHLACSGGHVEVARLLLEHGTNVSAQNENMSTPLHLALSGGHAEVALALLEHDADVTVADVKKSTPLILALSGDHVEIAHTLLQRGADPTAQDEQGTTPLRLALSKGHAEFVPILLDRGADATAEDEHGTTPLHMASSEGHVTATRILLEHGADVIAQDEHGTTPIHLASLGGHAEIVLILLQNGADATAQDEHGTTPLHRASSEGHREIALLLLDHRADFKSKDQDGSTPLHLASSEGHSGVALVLLEHGANAIVKDKDGSTPLHLASLKGHANIVLILLDHGADVTAQNEDGSTPLHLASSWGRVEVVLLLLERGADVTAKDQHETTPLRLALSWGHTEVVRVLRECGTDATADDEDDQPPIILELGGWADVANALNHFGSDSDAYDNVIWVPSEDMSLGEFHMMMQLMNPPEDWDGESELV